MLNLIISLFFYSFDFKSSFLQQYIMGTREIRRNNIILGGNFSAQMGHNVAKYFINNRFLRERGMVSNPKTEHQAFLCVFQKNSTIATLGLKEMGKFLWGGREKGLPCWLP